MEADILSSGYVDLTGGVPKGCAAHKDRTFELIFLSEGCIFGKNSSSKGMFP